MNTTILKALHDDSTRARLVLDGGEHSGTLQDIVGLLLLYPLRPGQSPDTVGELVEALQVNGHEVEVKL